ncbi:MAG: hypothetical protein ACJ8D6_11290 [Sphingomicrobium sp.]
MGRRIRTMSLQSSGGPEADKFFDRVVKYIPGDVVGGWVAATGIIRSQAQKDPNLPAIFWSAFVAGLLLTALWTYQQTKEPGKAVATTQILVAVAAFAVWAFALGGPFELLAWYKSYLGSLVLIAFTLGVGAIIPKQ